VDLSTTLPLRGTSGTLTGTAGALLAPGLSTTASYIALDFGLMGSQAGIAIAEQTPDALNRY
jgi:hypothetical protein